MDNLFIRQLCVSVHRIFSIYFCCTFSDVNDPISWNLSHTEVLNIWRKSIDELLKTIIYPLKMCGFFFNSLFLKNFYCSKLHLNIKKSLKTWVIIIRVMDFIVKLFCSFVAFEVLIHLVQYPRKVSKEYKTTNPLSNLKTIKKKKGITRN